MAVVCSSLPLAYILSCRNSKILAMQANLMCCMRNRKRRQSLPSIWFSTNGLDFFLHTILHNKPLVSIFQVEMRVYKSLTAETVWSTALLHLQCRILVQQIHCRKRWLKSICHLMAEFWQSNWYMLPGGKHGINKYTGQLKRLISWKN